MSLARYIQVATRIGGTGFEYSGIDAARWDASGSTIVNGDDSDGPAVTFTTSGALYGSAMMRTRDVVARAEWGTSITWRVKTGASIANYRVHAGLFAGVLPQSVASYSVELAAFRYSTDVDGTAYWRCLTCDGSSTTSTTAATAIATSTSYLLRIDVTTSSVLFYINGTLVATHTTNLPAAATKLSAIVSLVALTAAAKSLSFGEMRMGEASTSALPWGLATPGSSKRFLAWNGTSALEWRQYDLGGDGAAGFSTGVLPVVNGGTGSSTQTFWHMLKVASDQSGIGTSATNVTGLTVAVTNGQTIRFRARLLVTTSATTIGGMVTCNGPTASTVNFETREWQSAALQNFNHQTAFDAVSSQTAGQGSSARWCWVDGYAKFTADGTFAIRAQAETAGTMSVLAGSWLEYEIA